MGETTPEKMELECPGCGAFFRLRPKNGRFPDKPIPCPKCGTRIPIPTMGLAEPSAVLRKRRRGGRPEEAPITGASGTRAPSPFGTDREDGRTAPLAGLDALLSQNASPTSTFVGLPSLAEESRGSEASLDIGSSPRHTIPTSGGNVVSATSPLGGGIETLGSRRNARDRKGSTTDTSHFMFGLDEHDVSGSPASPARLRQPDPNQAQLPTGPVQGAQRRGGTSPQRETPFSLDSLEFAKMEAGLSEASMAGLPPDAWGMPEPGPFDLRDILDAERGSHQNKQLANEVTRNPALESGAGLFPAGFNLGDQGDRSNKPMPPIPQDMGMDLPPRQPSRRPTREAPAVSSAPQIPTRENPIVSPDAPNTREVPTAEVPLSAPAPERGDVSGLDALNALFGELDALDLPGESEVDVNSQPTMQRPPEETQESDAHARTTRETAAAPAPVAEEPPSADDARSSIDALDDLFNQLAPPEEEEERPHYEHSGLFPPEQPTEEKPDVGRPLPTAAPGRDNPDDFASKDRPQSFARLQVLKKQFEDNSRNDLRFGVESHAHIVLPTADLEGFGSVSEAFDAFDSPAQPDASADAAPATPDVAEEPPKKKKPLAALLKRKLGPRRTRELQKPDDEEMAAAAAAAKPAPPTPGARPSLAPPPQRPTPATRPRLPSLGALKPPPPRVEKPAAEEPAPTPAASAPSTPEPPRPESPAPRLNAPSISLPSPGGLPTLSSASVAHTPEATGDDASAPLTTNPLAGNLASTPSGGMAPSLSVASEGFWDDQGLGSLTGGNLFDIANLPSRQPAPTLGESAPERDPDQSYAPGWFNDAIPERTPSQLPGVTGPGVPAPDMSGLSFSTPDPDPREEEELANFLLGELSEAAEEQEALDQVSSPVDDVENFLSDTQRARAERVGNATSFGEDIDADELEDFLLGDIESGPSEAQDEDDAQDFLAGLDLPNEPMRGTQPGGLTDKSDSVVEPLRVRRTPSREVHPTLQGMGAQSRFPGMFPDEEAPAVRSSTFEVPNLRSSEMQIAGLPAMPEPDDARYQSGLGREPSMTGLASERRGSGYIPLPTTEILDVLGEGQYRLRVEDIIYEPIDEQGLAKLIKHGVLLGAGEMATLDGDWMPVSEHPVFKRLRRRMAREAHTLLSRYSMGNRSEASDAHADVTQLSEISQAIAEEELRLPEISEPDENELSRIPTGIMSPSEVNRAANAFPEESEARQSDRPIENTAPWPLNADAPPEPEPAPKPRERRATQQAWFVVHPNQGQPDVPVPPETTEATKQVDAGMLSALRTPAPETTEATKQVDADALRSLRAPAQEETEEAAPPQVEMDPFGATDSAVDESDELAFAETEVLGGADAAAAVSAFGEAATDDDQAAAFAPTQEAQRPSDEALHAAATSQELPPTFDDGQTGQTHAPTPEARQPEHRPTENTPAHTSGEHSTVVPVGEGQTDLLAQGDSGNARYIVAAIVILLLLVLLFLALTQPALLGIAALDPELTTQPTPAALATRALDLILVG